MNESERVIGLYQRHAAAFDRRRGRALFEKPWLDRFAAMLPAAGSVLDIGCGMGEPMARYLVERGFAVTPCPARAALMFNSGPAAGEEIGEFEGEPLYCASLLPTEYRALLAANCFVLQDHRADDAECGGATVWLALRS